MTIVGELQGDINQAIVKLTKYTPKYKNMVKCEICGKQGANLYCRGKRVCTICFYTLKHIHFVPFRRVLKRKGLWVEFLEAHPEFIHVDYTGKHRLVTVKVTAYLESIE